MRQGPACFLVAVLLASPAPHEGQLYMSTSLMGVALQAELHLFKQLERHHQSPDGRMDTTLMKYYRSFANVTADDLEAQLLNPLNGYLLFRRMSLEWPVVLKQRFGSHVPTAISRGIHSFVAQIYAENDDLEGALLALFRLQLVYRVPVSALVRGNDLWGPVSSGYSSAIGFELGHRALKLGHMGLAKQWANQETGNEENFVPGEKDIETIYRLFGGLGLLNSSQFKVLSKKMADFMSSGNVTHVLIDDLTKSSAHETTADQPADDNIHSYSDHAASLCRSDAGKIRPVGRYYCRYKRDSPYFLLRPLREEVLENDPFVALYHDLMTDHEMDVITVLSRAKLRRAGVGTGMKAHKESNSYRVASSAWLSENDHGVLKTISQKVHMATHLSLDSAENWQVVNYGLGGFYGSHFDWYNASNLHAGAGNRIATAMFYISAVAAGGATVFPLLDLVVLPEKGAMTLWYNIRRSGQPDRRTLHTGCPVLSGSKWVANLWFREREQEFIRPCALSPHL